MDAALFERLLNEEESSTLDFKSEQYRFVEASDDDKSELLKDILAFANAWKRSDAYILVGVEEIRGGRSKVVGVSEHLQDHSLQQFVNHKINRPLHFSYEAFTFEGKQVGIIKIEQQIRPFFLKSDYGRLKKNAVYIRRGSSTGEADGDEIARMITPVIQEEANLQLEFAELNREVALGTSIQLQSVFYEMPPKDAIPSYKGPRRGRYDFAGTMDISNRPNESYYREKAEYIFLSESFCPARFLVTNSGDTTAENVRVEIIVVKEAGIGVIAESDLPQLPEKKWSVATMRLPKYQNPLLRYAGQVNIESHSDKFKIIIDCGTLQPKRPITTDQIFLGRYDAGVMYLSGIIYADNLSVPKTVELSADFSVTHKQMSISELTAYKVLKKSRE
ncbi:MAG TPA: ATP-binding protein [Thermoguttaceae bacterium]